MDNLEEYLNEGTTATSKDYAELESLTDNNDHNGWVIKLAKMLKNKKAEKAMKGMVDIHMYFNNMPQELIAVRKMISDMLLEEAKKKFGEEVAKIIYKTG